MSEPLLALEAVSKTYGGGYRLWPFGHRAGFTAVAGVDLVIESGAAVGLVGESGSGKTTLARIAAGLLPASAGGLRWCGRALMQLSRAERAEYRRGVQYIFQNPMTALNPHRRVGAALDDTLQGLTRMDRARRRARIEEIGAQTGVGAALLGRFPHQLSGGQAQRVAIARALLGAPRLVILDEPVSALDVSLQAQILNLLADLRARHGLAYLFISHDLAVMERLCEQIHVMQAGRIVESGPRDVLLRRPEAPYTRRLLAAVPRIG
ncbi:MAG: ATP-binding cassette domain-containing protein [Thiohalocapsa sp.]|uniref:ABC transporter ATP-binding protein n=1 Tax=Thiohalocapsa sp. TaxID=2497641 RepID=UPI0025FF56A3|nr:ATP-binding cassette domain-containing protein [Thiohalocapsa sp.]MCG6943564.1 ATP-binding cassette domain-containing protein [Thiohalocapsa sp.]